MLKNIFKIILIFIFIFLFVVLFSFTYYLKSKPNNTPFLEESKSEAKEKQHRDNLRKSYDEHFPDFITGTLIIISEKEARIKNEEGKEFLIDPARPIAYYLESGVKSESKAVLQGKVIDQEKVFMGNIKPFENSQ